VADLRTSGRREKGCFLNLVASLRTRPLVSTSLIQHVDHAFAVYNDRAFMQVGLELPTDCGHPPAPAP
jgi:hypothetical protein